MITAVNEWALARKPKPWRHPLPSIKQALEEKAQGRVFQIDTDSLERPDDVSEADWQTFLGRSTFVTLYFDYDILDE